MSLRVDLVEGARIAVQSLRNHRLRTVLTTVGVGIGVATLLAIVGIIQGMNTSFDQQLQSLGSTTLYVSKRPWVQMGDWWKYRNRKPIGKTELEAVRTQLPLATAIAPMDDEREDVSFLGNELTAVDITGTTADWPAVAGFDLTQGRFFTEGENDARSFVAVIGQDVVDSLFPNAASPLGAHIKVASRYYTVVGVLSRKGKILDQSQDLTVVVPLSAFMEQFGGRRSLDIGVAVPTPDDLPKAEDQLIGILRRARQTPPGEEDDFAINKPEQLASTYQQLTGALFGVAVGIGFITLLVGGIGIMNIMLVSVRERTREIGLRRALGARKRTIVAQFILEAMAVSAVGGALGTGVGLTGAKLISMVTPLAATVKPFTVLFGVAFASLVGLLFGIWPAARAANLDPVEALRHE